ncbi:hypothetical protein FB_0205 [Escherichia phage vB_EcoM_FB]|uniref:Uncharacterized protein n=1 Tax=Escherichia phage QL01 TaxID=1673871 RepID=A0A0K1LK87_9CAUD|nr:hypothetical protein AVT32_gp206 [Escherichia phage QL01]QJA42467.1 hypothetical protein [Enterobacteria phage vB_EcoM_IME540]QLF81519.1 hypothetical protein FB_0205 [Escherichia phage vB_EcoM_FB]QXV72299.1 hypothetical protein PSD9_14 [Shigella phage PSD9]BBI57559.1 hypothetical protein KIT01_211 [Escherichia phage KIT01]AKU42864.1 hypothetical protein QL01_207 [Escherichia phage QL01]
MFKKLIQKLLGTEMVEVTYRVTDLSPVHPQDEPYTKTIKMLKSDGGLSIEDRLPGYGHWADVEIISVKDV